jgi:hypothetical protein
MYHTYNRALKGGHPRALRGALMFELIINKKSSQGEKNITKNRDKCRNKFVYLQSTWRMAANSFCLFVCKYIYIYIYVCIYIYVMGLAVI